MNWRENHRVPEVTEWIMGLKESWYPLRCPNCYSFPMLLVKFHDVQRRECLFCKVQLGGGEYARTNK